MDHKSNLRARDICAIIKSCSQNGVTVFRFGDLSLQFEPIEISRSPVAMPDWPKAPYHPEASAVAQEKLEQVDKNLVEDMRLSQLLIDDPLGYEQEMIDAHMRGTNYGGAAQN